MGRGQSNRSSQPARLTSSLLIGAYSTLLTAALVLSAPWWISKMLTTGRFRDGLRERLGRVPWRLQKAVRGRRVVWVHAVSVGEALAVSRLVSEMQEALGAGWIVVLSTTTRTGQALAQERFGADRVFFFPLDFAWAVRAYLRALRPALLVLVESELWPRMLWECHRAAVPVAVVNARVSDRSFRRALRVRRLWATLLGKLSLWLAQSEADATRLDQLGVPASSIQVSGNLKYDIRAPRESRVAALIREAAAGRPILVAGSTTGGVLPKDTDESQLVLQAWKGELRTLAGALLVLAPRHPENFDLVYSAASEFSVLRATELLQDGRDEKGISIQRDARKQGRTEIVLLDSIGDLAAVYAIADVAFVGGSLVRRGGHNPLEPARFGVPVLMGPSFENFREIVAKLQAANALCVIEDVEGLEAAMLALLKDRTAAQAMGQRGLQVFEREGGATARTLAAMLPFLAVPREALPGRPPGSTQELEA